MSNEAAMKMLLIQLPPVPVEMAVVYVTVEGGHAGMIWPESGLARRALADAMRTHLAELEIIKSEAARQRLAPSDDPREEKLT